MISCISHSVAERCVCYSKDYSDGIHEINPFHRDRVHLAVSFLQYFTLPLLYTSYNGPIDQYICKTYFCPAELQRFLILNNLTGLLNTLSKDLPLFVDQHCYTINIHDLKFTFVVNIFKVVSTCIHVSLCASKQWMDGERITSMQPCMENLGRLIH